MLRSDVCKVLAPQHLMHISVVSTYSRNSTGLEHNIFVNAVSKYFVSFHG